MDAMSFEDDMPKSFLDDDTDMVPGEAAEAKTATRVRPFTVKTRTTKVPYTFKNFVAARQGKDLFSASEATLEEKLALFDAVQAHLIATQKEIASLREKGVVTNGGPELFLVPVCFLTVDDTWCRNKLVDWNHVAEIAHSFREKSFLPPLVTLRKVFSAAGKVIDVVISLPDGVHRTTAFREIGGTHLRALVQIVDDVVDEAQIYSDNNYNRRSHNGLDLLKVLYALSDAEVVKIHEIISDYGFEFPETSRSPWPKIGAIRAVINSYRTHGEDVVRRVLWLLSQKEFKLWYGDKKSISGDMIVGLSRYVATFERPGYIHSSLTEHIMATNTPEFVTKQIGLMLPTTTMTQIIQSPVEVSGDSEQARGIRICCAFVTLIKELFKPSKAAMRPSNYHPKFRDALETFYDTSKDARDKADAVTSIRRFFAKRKQPDCWCDESSIVR